MDRVKIIKHHNGVYVYYSSHNKTMRLSTQIKWGDKDKHSDIINNIHNIYTEIVDNYFEKFLELPTVDYVKNTYIEYKENKKEEERIKYERSLDRRKVYYDKNRKGINKKRNQRKEEKRKSDPIFRSQGNIRQSIRASIINGGYTKKSRTHEILGCSFEDFRNHIEGQWEEWMNWDNYGLYNGTYQYGWDLDHIIPISNGNTEEDIIELNHYTNFQPLCSKENRNDKRANENYVNRCFR